METQLKPKAKSIAVSRIVLNEGNAKHLQEWVGQLREACPGIRVKKQDVVNWLISEKGSRLTPGDLKALKDRFFDDVALAEWALRQLRAAKARSEPLTLADLVQRPPAIVRKSRKTKMEKAEDGGTNESL
jgi:hypothetical protein